MNMNMKTKKRNHADDLHASGLAFGMISLMHDNPLLARLKDPYRLLKTARLRPGQKVLEVGCGPGFFTVPAAGIVGQDGIVYAVDVNPRAIKRVEEKKHKYGLTNIKTVQKNAGDCGLPDGSIDLAFVFGLRHIAGGIDSLAWEIHRILKSGGTLSFEKTTGSGERLIANVEEAGFSLAEQRGRIFIFTKKENGAG